MIEDRSLTMLFYELDSDDCFSVLNTRSESPLLGNYHHAHNSTRYTEENRGLSLLSGFSGAGYRERQLAKKKEIITTTIKYFITDLTGVQKTRGSLNNTLLSISNDDWINTPVNQVSISPFINDIARTGRLYHYYLSIRYARYLAREDGLWAISLRLVLTPLKKYIDQLYKISNNNLEDDLVSNIYLIKYEIELFLPSALEGGLAPGQKVSKVGQTKFRSSGANLRSKADSNSTPSPVNSVPADVNKTACLLDAAKDGSAFVRGAE